MQKWMEIHLYPLEKKLLKYKSEREWKKQHNINEYLKIPLSAWGAID